MLGLFFVYRRRKRTNIQQKTLYKIQLESTERKCKRGEHVNLPFTNISYVQKRLLDYLRNHLDFMVIDTDKNMGPAIIERETYVQLILTEHLLTETYQRITEEQVRDTIKDLSKEIKELVGFEHERDLDDDKQLYFGRGLMAKY